MEPLFLTISFDNMSIPTHLCDTPSLIYFLTTSNESTLDWFMEMWGHQGILKVVDWVETTKYSFSLLLDLSPLDIEGEVAVLPFPWMFGQQKPTVVAAIQAWRRFTQEKTQ